MARCGVRIYYCINCMNRIVLTQHFVYIIFCFKPGVLERLCNMFFFLFCFFKDVSLWFSLENSVGSSYSWPNKLLHFYTWCYIKGDVSVWRNTELRSRLDMLTNGSRVNVRSFMQKVQSRTCPEHPSKTLTVGPPYYGIMNKCSSSVAALRSKCTQHCQLQTNSQSIGMSDLVNSNQTTFFCLKAVQLCMKFCFFFPSFGFVYLFLYIKNHTVILEPFPPFFAKSNASSIH